jgi:hypothetical protein
MVAATRETGSHTLTRMPSLSTKRKRLLFEKLRLYARSVGRAAVAQKLPKRPKRRWSDSDIVVDPPERYSSILPRRPRGEPPLEFRVVPREYFVKDSIAQALQALEAAKAQEAKAAAKARLAEMASSSAGSPSEERRKAIRAERMADAAARMRKKAALRAKPRGSCYASVARSRREKPVRFGTSRPLAGPVTGFMSRRASMPCLLDVFMKRGEAEPLREMYLADFDRDLERDRPSVKLMTMLAGFYMPNVISKMTDKKIKATKFHARELPEFEDFYTEEKLRRREMNRYLDTITDCTHKLWEAYTNCLGSKMTEKNHGLFFKHLNLAINKAKGLPAARNSLRSGDPHAEKKNMRDDWLVDSNGNELIDYPHFALAVWEAAEVSCDSVRGTEVEELYEDLVGELTKIEPKYHSRVLAFPFNPRDAYGAPSAFAKKLRRVAVLVNLVDGMKSNHFRTPPGSPREAYPPLPPVKGPVAPTSMRVPVVTLRSKLKRYPRPAFPAPTEYDFDYLSHHGAMLVADVAAADSLGRAFPRVSQAVIAVLARVMRDEDTDADDRVWEDWWAGSEAVPASVGVDRTSTVDACTPSPRADPIVVPRIYLGQSLQQVIAASSSPPADDSLAPAMPSSACVAASSSRSPAWNPRNVRSYFPAVKRNSSK